MQDGDGSDLFGKVVLAFLAFIALLVLLAKIT